ncbi:MAG: DEAD/DEAH box helicase [Verrucomicrobia bacterium]|nr:DEAD/DEAH box helicase [Verrucomicrobiota bacterium]
MSELVYRIEPKEPNSLLVHLQEKGSKRVLYLDTLKTLAREADREPLAFLIKIHLRSPNVSRTSDTASFQQIEVPAAQSSEAIRLMAKTGRLYFQKTLLSVNPVPAKLYWRGERLSEKSATLEAIAGELPLAEAEAAFPFWVIQKGVFSSLSTDLPWKWIEPFLKKSALLEGVQLKRFLEENPPVLWKAKQAEKPLEVFPQLVLQDATGCFAHLWMDYPGVGRVVFEDLSPTVSGRARLRANEEQWEKDLLETGFIRKVVGATRYFCPSDRIQESLCFLLEIGWKIIDAQGRSILRQTGCDLSIQENRGKIEISGRVRFQDKEAPIGKFPQRLWLELDKESVGLIDRKALGTLGELLDEAELVEKKWIVPKQRISALSNWLDQPNVDWSEQLRETVSRLDRGIEDALPGEAFRGELLPYQQKGVDWLSHLHRYGFSGLLADEMGLGKTVQVLAFFSRMRTNLPLLIVAPTSLLFNWKKELSRFLPNLPVYIHAGSERLKDPSQLQKLPLILTSYSVLRLDEDLLSQIDCEAIVLDESQTIKNSSTQTAQAAGRLKSNFRICLSGTPIENRTSELVSQFQFLLPDLLEPTDPIERLKKKTRPFILRRRKQDVEIELPEKIDQSVWIEMNPSQSELYQEYKKGLKGGLLKKIEQEGAVAHRMEILEAILRLRQICCDPRLLGENFLGAKLEQLKTDVEEAVAEKRKILIYSQFTSMLTLIKKELAEYSPLYLDGSMSYEERGTQVKQFQEDPNSLVFLLSLKAGGAGLNLTAAEYVLLFDPWWNEAAERQAIDRAHRIGQKKTIIAKRYLTPDSIEEKMLALKEKKQAAASQILDPGVQEEEFSWTSEDLLHLLF